MCIRDSPILYHDLFVGRENDVEEVVRRVASAHIVNINGAPGFGKSTLAIHVGYELVKKGTSVRYINVEDKLSLLKDEKGDFKGDFNCTASQQVPIDNTSSVIEFSRTSLVTPLNSTVTLSHSTEVRHLLKSYKIGVLGLTVLLFSSLTTVMISS